MRIASYSLLLSLILSIVIFITVNSSIVESLLFRKSIIQYREVINHSLNSISGVYLSLETNLVEQESIDLQIIPNGNDSVRVLMQKWGVFDLVTSYAIKNGRVMAKKTAMIGSEPNNSKCLILSNSNRPLALSGKTTIQGDCVLPKLGVKRAYIEGQNFQGKQLIEGNITYNTLSNVPSTYKIKYRNAFNGNFENSGSIIYYSSEVDSLINPFSHPRIILLCENETTITGYYKGNIIIYSNETLNINATSKLTDVQVIAGSIHIKSAGNCSGQFFAKENIECSNSQLVYPSILALNEASNESNDNGIFISNSTIDGGVYLETAIIHKKKKPGITVKDNSIVRGQLVSNSWVDLRGKVIGQVITNYFFLKTASSVYENHLLEASITNRDFPKSFPLYAQTGKKTIAKWVD